MRRTTSLLALAFTTIALAGCGSDGAGLPTAAQAVRTTAVAARAASALTVVAASYGGGDGEGMIFLTLADATGKQTKATITFTDLDSLPRDSFRALLIGNGTVAPVGGPQWDAVLQALEAAKPAKNVDARALQLGLAMMRKGAAGH